MSSPLRVYATQHVISRTVCDSFARGVPGAQVVPAITLLDGDVALYGLLRGTHEVLIAAKEKGRNWWYIDLGFIGRSNHYNLKFDGYYRVSRNAYQSNCLGEYPSDRWELLETELKPWKRGGKHILVCPMSYNLAVHLNLDPKNWLKSIIEEISKYTDRTIMIKPKSSELTLEEALLDAHCIVGFDTNALVDAVISGIPAFNLGRSAVQSVALQDLSKIESPIYPDRKPWAYALAYNQFTLKEFRDGTCWRILNENLDNNKEVVRRTRNV